MATKKALRKRKKSPLSEQADGMNEWSANKELAEQVVRDIDAGKPRPGFKRDRPLDEKPDRNSK